MAFDARVYELLDRVYAAAENPVSWPAALAQMGTLFDVRGFNLFFNDEDNRPNGITVNHGLDPELINLYNQHYVTVDPLVEASLHAPVGTVVDSEELFTNGWWRRHELYGELSAPFGIEHIRGATVLASSDGFAAFSMLRGPGVEVSREERLLLDALLPHLMRAMTIHSRLGAAEERSRLLSEVIDRLDLGVVLVDQRGRVVQANDAALALVRQRDGFALRRDAVVAAEGGQTAALLSLVAEVVCGGVTASGGALRLARPSGRRHLEVLVVPLSSRQREAGDAAAVAALFITDPEHTPCTAEQLLQQVYGLTPAEARLAAALLEGVRVEEAAERFGVTCATVRTQLRAVFAKTDTSRQSELVRLLLRSPAGGIVRSSGDLRTCQ